MRLFASGALALLAALALTACAAVPSGAPTSTAEPTGIVETARMATVLDDGTGPQLCLGPIAMSYPPQCGGPAITGWDWADWTGAYTEASGVRWGAFWVAGHYDEESDAFTVTDAEPGDEHVWPETEQTAWDFSSPCSAPAGGWAVRDAALTTAATLDAALSYAATSPGYASAWVDQSPNPLWNTEPATDEGWAEYEAAMNDPLLTILNVRTSGDVAALETALQERWGGMLCVSAAERSEAELGVIQEELTAGALGRPLSAGTDAVSGRVLVDVMVDDGTLQQAADERYGAGLVVVTAALVPLS